MYVRGVPEALLLPPRLPEEEHTAVAVNASPAAWSRALYAAEQTVRIQRVSGAAVGPLSGVRGLRDGVRRAARVAAIVGRSSGEPRLFTQRDLTLDLLLSAVDSEACDGFVAGVLGPVLDLAPSRAAPLLETLRVLSGSGGGFAAAAKVLGVHRETVKYRVRRVQELTGYVATDPAHRTHLDIALRLAQQRGTA
jgi:DNA-binding PucR family transcriptional regulator